MFAADELFKEGGWGGSRDFVWDHEKYWPAFVRMCDEIAKGRMARWRKLGARVGCDENDYKTEDLVGAVPGSRVNTSTAEAEDGAAETDDMGEGPVVSQAHCQTSEETSASESGI